MTCRSVSAVEIAWVQGGLTLAIGRPGLWWPARPVRDSSFPSVLLRPVTPTSSGNLLEMQIPWFHPRQSRGPGGGASALCLNQPSRWLWHALKIENHWFMATKFELGGRLRPWRHRWATPGVCPASTSGMLCPRRQLRLPKYHLQWSPMCRPRNKTHSVCPVWIAFLTIVFSGKEGWRQHIDFETLGV